MIMLPLFMLSCLAAGWIRRVPLYDVFLKGAKEGLNVAKEILPSMIAMLCAVRAFSACGLLDQLCGALEPVSALMGLPRETMPLMLLRPLSGSGSLAMLREILSQYGPDSRAGMTACVMMGSSETIFYTCGIYLSAAGVKKSRHTIPCALLSWLAGSIAAGLLMSRMAE